ncbi:MAG: class I SAM-dependent methyltransferase [Nitrospirae bacterium]|nr:class I SAM-dependent methyltransferase [Nitrospirota bacterium]
MGLGALIKKCRGLLDFGERVTHLTPNDMYYAHLSIYRFAMGRAANKIVLDAGCGEGYGSAYMARSGAGFVHGIEIGPGAVGLAREHFNAPNLKFHEMDIQNISGFEEHSIDFIVCSNVLEHIPNPWLSLHSFAKILKPDGVFLLAVPPITDDGLKMRNLAIPYHLNIWTPRQWHYAVGCFFEDVQRYRHWFRDEDVRQKFGIGSTRASCNETDFVFEQVQLQETNPITPTMTLILTARSPIEAIRNSDISQKLSLIDGSFTRLPVTSAGMLLWRHLYGIYLRGQQDGYTNLLRRGYEILRRSG